MPSDIARLLRQRGHEITSEGCERDILLPATDNAELAGAFKTVLFDLMRSDSVRKALRDWAYGKRFPGDVSAQKIESYIDLCRKIGNWSNTSDQADQKRYATTFEWYVSELLRREFAARASGFNIRLKDANPDDEFDCIALLDNGLVFVECKTGKESLYGEIAKFVRRDVEVNATYSFFVFDRDYTFDKDGTDTPQLSKEQAANLGIESIWKISAGSQAFFYIKAERNPTGWPKEQRFFMACTAFDGFEKRVRYMIRYTNMIQQTHIPSSDLFKASWIQFTGGQES